MKTYFNDFWDKCKESARSILPFFAIILTLYLIFMTFNIWAFLSIILATLIMMIGMALFSVGVDMSTMKMVHQKFAIDFAFVSHLSVSSDRLLLAVSFAVAFGLTWLTWKEEAEEENITEKANVTDVKKR